MTNSHIEDLTIENFKCFKHLEINNIGRVNLIGGKNNVGKTAFLEAMELFFLSYKSNSGQHLIYSAYKIFKRRQNTNQIELDINFYNNESEIKIISYQENKSICNDISLIIDNKDYETWITGTVKENSMKTTLSLLWSWSDYNHLKTEKNIYIDSSKLGEQNIAIFYGALIEHDLEEFLNNRLNLFDNNIIALKQIVTQQGVVLKLKLKNRENLALLSSLGEGINRYIAILCAIWASKDSVLLIDEIENGIHYTNYKKLWQIIFQSSIDANCQLFITTHSKECISAFNEVQFENQQCNAQYFEFYKNLKTDLITAAAIDKDELLYCLTNNRGIRGE